MKKQTIHHSGYSFAPSLESYVDYAFNHNLYYTSLVGGNRHSIEFNFTDRDLLLYYNGMISGGTIPSVIEIDDSPWLPFGCGDECPAIIGYDMYKNLRTEIYRDVPRQEIGNRSIIHLEGAVLGRTDGPAIIQYLKAKKK